MTEQELAEEFSRELDGFIAGGKPLFQHDQPAMDLAARLAACGRGSDPELQAELRRRLCPGGFRYRLQAMLASGAVRTAFAAACVVLALLPVLHRSADGPALPQPAAFPGPAAIPAARTAPAQAGVPTAAGLAMPVRTAGAALELFGTLPMGAIGGDAEDVFPIATLPARVTASGLTWETEGAVFVYERRAVSPGELIEMLGSSR